MFTLWIWPEDRKPEAEKAVRDALKEKGFEFEEKTGYVCDKPVALDTGFEELDEVGIKEKLGRYSVSETGEILLCGMTAEEFDKRFETPKAPSAEDEEDAVIAEINGKEDK